MNNLYVYIYIWIYTIHMYVYRCFIRRIVEIVFSPPKDGEQEQWPAPKVPWELISATQSDTVYLGVRLAQTSDHPGIEHG